MLINTRVRYLQDLLRTFLAEVERFKDDGHVAFGASLNLRDEVRRFEIELINYGLQQTHGHQGRAARLLGMNASTLNAKLKLYGLLSKANRRMAKDKRTALDISACPGPMMASDVTAAEIPTSSVS